MNVLISNFHPPDERRSDSKFEINKENSCLPLIPNFPVMNNILTLGLYIIPVNTVLSTVGRTEI